MPSQLVEKLLDKNFSEQSLLEFEEDFHPSSEGLWNKAKEIAESKFGFPSSEGLDYAIKWFNLKEGYWITHLTDEELEEFFQMEDGDMSEGTLHDWFGKSKSKDGKPGWVQSDGSPCANEKGETKTPKCYSSQRLAALKRKGKKGKSLIRSADARKSKQDPGQQSKSGADKPTYVKTFAKKKDFVSSGDGKNEEYVMEAKDNKSSGSGSKDACYHKVKSRFKVWPSAYASGALVKCRKSGASNWGNSTKKEEVEHVDEDYKKLPKVKMGMKAGKKFISAVKDTVKGESEPEGTIPQQIGQQKAAKKTRQADKIHRVAGKHNETLSRAKSMKNKLVGMTKKEETETVSERDRVFKALEEAKSKKKCGCDKSHDESESIEESTRIPSQNGNVYMVTFTWKGKFMVMKVFFPEVKRPSKSQVQDALNKVYPGCIVKRYDMTDIQPGETHLNIGVGEEVQMKETEHLEEKSAAWTRAAGKNKKGGLNEKGRKSYERENPGSDLKRPSKVKGNKRRASFCSRMRGMKKKLTSAKTARDPDSRINKSLRAWDCN